MPVFQLPITHKRPINGVYAFYINAFLRALTFSLISIFIPIFIYQMGIKNLYPSSVSILFIALYYFIVRFFTLILCFPVSKIIEKIGFRYSVGISLISLILYFIFLKLSTGNIIYLFFSALLLGITLPFYWIARNSAVCEDFKEKQLGRQAGMISILEKISTILGPITGALIITNFSYGFLYNIAIIILGISIIPLLFMPHHIHRNGISLKGFVNWLKDKLFYHQAVASFTRGADDYSWGLIWPFILFMLKINLKTIGFLFSLVSILTVITRFLSSLAFDQLRKEKKHSDKKLFKFLTIASSIIWLIRIFVKTVFGVLLVDGSSTFFNTPYRNISDDYLFLGGRRMHEIAYFTYREIIYSIGILVFLGLMTIGIYFNFWKEMVLITTAVFIFLSQIQARESNL